MQNEDPTVDPVEPTVDLEAYAEFEVKEPHDGESALGPYAEYPVVEAQDALESMEKYQGQVLELPFYGSPVLRESCSPIVEIDELVTRLAADMTVTMLEYQGAGISAPQVGVPFALCIIQEGVSENGSVRVRTMINPTITEASGEHYMLEGCLSIPGARGTVQRFAKITVQYRDLLGNSQTETFEGDRASLVQHEVDHLRGILFIDHLSPFGRSRALQRHRKVLKQAWRKVKRNV